MVVLAAIFSTVFWPFVTIPDTPSGIWRPTSTSEQAGVATSPTDAPTAIHSM